MSTVGIGTIMLGILFVTEQHVCGSFFPGNQNKKNTDPILGSTVPGSLSFQMSSVEPDVTNNIGLGHLVESDSSGSGSDDILSDILSEGRSSNRKTSVDIGRIQHLDIPDEYRAVHLPEETDEMDMSYSVPDEDISDELIFQKCGTPNICTTFESYCPDGMMCRFDLDGCLPKCACFPDYVHCQVALSTKTNQHLKTSAIPTLKDGNVKSLKRKKDSGAIGCVETRKIPVEKCHSSLTCYNGHCMRAPLSGGGVEVYCSCSEGWQGRSCDVCCPLQCNNGSCEVEPSTGSMLCACQFGHRGERCEEKVELEDVALGKSAYN